MANEPFQDAFRYPDVLRLTILEFCCIDERRIVASGSPSPTPGHARTGATGQGMHSHLAGCWNVTLTQPSGRPGLLAAFKAILIQYTDDDGETSTISSEDTLTEAINYFGSGGDESSSSSLFGGPRKISISVEINMEYDGISLSDNSSIRSFEGISGRNLSQASFNYCAHRPEVDDDSVTVSSRDTGVRSPSRLSTPSLSPPQGSASSSNLSPPQVTAVSQSRFSATAGRLRKIASSLSGRSRDRSFSGLEESAAARFPENPSAVFERLRYDEQNSSDTSSVDHTFGRDARGAAWLRDQNERVTINVLGGLPAPSESDASSMSVSIQDDTQSARFSGISHCSRMIGANVTTRTPPLGPTLPSHNMVKTEQHTKAKLLDWLAAQQVSFPAPSLRSNSHNSDPLPCREHIHENGIPQGLGQYIPQPFTATGTNHRLLRLWCETSHLSSAHGPGYELCSGCLETDGVTHAKEGPLIPSLPPSPQDLQGHSSTSRHKAPLRHAFQEKVWGHTGWDDVGTYYASPNRSQIHELHPSHAFLVVPERRLRSYSDPDHIPVVPLDMSDEESRSIPPRCTYTPSNSKRKAMKHPGIKCSQYDLHSLDLTRVTKASTSCLQDIVGARFHCLLCQAVDICSNCESAGLPGNFDPTESGHTSAHVMIKIPYPLDSSEVSTSLAMPLSVLTFGVQLHTASQRAINLWQRRDGGNLNHSTSETDLSSAVSSYAKTVVGSGFRVSLRGCLLTIMAQYAEAATRFLAHRRHPISMRDLPLKTSTIQPSMLVVILRSLSLLKSYLVRVISINCSSKWNDPIVGTRNKLRQGIRISITQRANGTAARTVGVISARIASLLTPMMKRTYSSCLKDR
ncbi:zz type zinc finger domain-containing protein [Salix suchowensis]|nr:zz type zinc finger domain-containing protein [Salix suchowensis]